MGKLKFCLVVDTEGFSMFWGFHPMWGLLKKIKFLLNRALKRIRYDEKGFYKIYKFVLREKFPVSFMLVGNKFKPLSKERFIDWGYHSYSHKRLTSLNDEKLQEEIKNIYYCTSFSPPMWFIENEKNPERVFKALKKEGYKIAVYAGEDSRIMAGKPVCKLSPISAKYGLKVIFPARNFNGGTSKKEILRIKKEILANLDKNAVYCLATHDFNNKNMANFIDIAKFIKRLERGNKLKTANLGELAVEK